MGDETKVDVYKTLTLDLLGGVGGWMGFDDIAADFELNYGEAHGNALRGALLELFEEGRVLREERGGNFKYRMAPTRVGESLADKVKRLEAALETSEAERLRLLGQLRACGTVGECVDTAAALAKSVLECAGLRAEQAADRTAVMALVEGLPRCEHPIADGAECQELAVPGFFCVAHSFGDAVVPAALRALQDRMATWPSEAEASARHASAEDVLDDVQAGSRGLTFEDAARRYPEAFERAWSSVKPNRFIDEFVDIDEPSVGDVDGYGRRG